MKSHASAGPESPARLSGEALGVVRGGLMLFRPVSFVLEPGDALLIEGRNGIGKTSLIKAMAGLGPLAQGRLDVAGLAETTLGEHLHYLGHEDTLRAQLTTLETALFYRDFYAGEGDVAEVFALLGLAGLEDIPAGYLSAGQKRKLAMSRLLLAHRTLWLLDEPLNALDTHARALVHRLIAAHREKGGMVIAISHGGLVMPGAGRLELREGEEAPA